MVSVVYGQGRILRGRMRDMHASVLRITLSCGIETPIIKMYSTLQFLKIDDMYKLELYNFMHQLHHSKLPDVFYKLFTIITSAHAHNIRFKQSAFHVSSPVNKSICKKNNFPIEGTIYGVKWTVTIKAYSTLDFL